MRRIKCDCCGASSEEKEVIAKFVVHKTKDGKALDICPGCRENVIGPIHEAADIVLAGGTFDPDGKLSGMRGVDRPTHEAPMGNYPPERAIKIHQPMENKE